ncbi:MAG: hypothetical protein K5894_09435 [Lachnospiraceae bacterium]|nr:hypothetical protein [Lachnospiraceae bacterium]
MSISATSINGYSVAQLFQMSGSKTEQLSQSKDLNKNQKFNYSAQAAMTVQSNIDNDTLQISSAGQLAYSMSQQQQSQYEAATDKSDTDGELKVYNEVSNSDAEDEENYGSVTDSSSANSASGKIVFSDLSIFYA